MPTTGLIVLHGNRLEDLLAAVAGWLREQPLAPLEQETLLVQSQGMGEWVRMQLAERAGISAALRVELPARFLWRAYRAALGREAVPQRSPLDKTPLVWRLMARLPEWLARDSRSLEPLRRFLGDASASRQLQLAQRLADLFDQYQVHRGDWLEDWAAGREVLRRLPDTALGARPLPAEDAWQPELWRAILESLPESLRGLSRPDIHQAFLARLRAVGPGGQPWPAALPRRVVVFGTTHIPQQALEAIAELACGSQVLMAVPNPCRHYWADLIPDRELLLATRRRQSPRPGMPAGNPELDELAPHGHPLLAGWGRQARDFIRLLDHHDDIALTRERFGDRRIDFFDEGGMEDGNPWLRQVQARIRELVPVKESPPAPPPPDDRSIVFHVAHHAQREVEILHDQLLHLLATGTAAGPLAPRDVVVMVPDIAAFEPAIRSVFGQHEGTGDARHIPHRIADLRDRGRSPLLVAIEWLLGARTERFTLSGLRALLDVPAVRARFDIEESDVPALGRWLEQAGVRWGLHAAHRAELGLAAAGEQNTWVFGLRRLLLGYAIGQGEFRGIDACDEVGGLEAAKLGALADLVEAIVGWWQASRADRTPREWQQALQELREGLFLPISPLERTLDLALDEAMANWLEACEAAGFAAVVDAAVVREAWLEAVDDPGLPRRFRAAGVTFCTLLPLRAVPFRVVCLLGMNDADYPRRGLRSDFDLMARAGLQRPGDRSGRDDDRQLMLDALLSARDVLYISWSGRSQRDDSEQPPSVLVAQLRDYLAQVWSGQAVAERTTHHPLQPFSVRYFQSSGELFTYSREWRAVHQPLPASPLPAAAIPGASPARATPFAAPAIDDLHRFLSNPVKEFFRRRLQVQFEELQQGLSDDEPFAVDGLEGWTLVQEILDALKRRDGQVPGGLVPAAMATILQQEFADLVRAGRLPLGAAGSFWQTEMRTQLKAMAMHWLALRSADAAVEFSASRLGDSRGRVRKEKLLRSWLRLLHEGKAGICRPLHLLGRDGAIALMPPAAAECGTILAGLEMAWARGTTGESPLPTAFLTGMACVEGGDPAPKYEGSGPDHPGEGAEACLARLYPDFESLLLADRVESPSGGHPEPAFVWWSHRLYAEFARWVATYEQLEPYASADAATVGEGGDD